MARRQNPERQKCLLISESLSPIEPEINRYVLTPAFYISILRICVSLSPKSQDDCS